MVDGVKEAASSGMAGGAALSNKKNLLEMK